MTSQILFGCLLMVLCIPYFPSIHATRHVATKNYVRCHNDARAKVGSPPVVWNETVAAYAQAYANERAHDCQMVHSQGPYGENIAMGTWDLTPENSVGMWYDEKKLYDPKSNKCIGGDEMGCLHYTQVVWNTTTSIGCGKTCCNNGWTFVVCNYNPPGNYIGERPY